MSSQCKQERLAALISAVQAYLDAHWTPSKTNDAQAQGFVAAMPMQAAAAQMLGAAPQQSKPRKLFSKASAAKESAAAPMPCIAMEEMADADSLAQRLQCLDESFSQMLLRKIDEKGLKDAECYKRANVDRKLFSKIRSDPGYRPSKPTAIAFAIALELPLDETGELLMKAGFALSHSSKFDVIIEYFIKQGNYNIMEINETLFAFDQSLLGA